MPLPLVALQTGSLAQATLRQDEYAERAAAPADVPCVSQPGRHYSHALPSVRHQPVIFARGRESFDEPLFAANFASELRILSLCCILYGVSLLSTMHQSGLVAPSGGLGALMNLGGINSNILARMGASLPLAYDIAQPWRFVTAVFLHASLLHIGFNLWVLMDIAPTIEELYGSARFLFIFVVTGASGYLASAAGGHFSVGASGALLGMIGVLLAITGSRSNMGSKMLRSQLIYWLIYIAVLGVIMPGVDNLAHIGGFASGFSSAKSWRTGNRPTHRSGVRLSRWDGQLVSRWSRVSR